MKLHIAIVTHRHGTNCYGAKTEEVLAKKIQEYVESWWDQEQIKLPKPEDKAEMVEAYFESVEDEYLDEFAIEILDE